MNPRTLKIAAASTLALSVTAAAAAAALHLMQADPPKGPVTPPAATPKDTNWTKSAVTKGLERPWAADWLPGDAGILVTARPGRLRLFVPNEKEGGTLRPEPIAGLPDIAAIGQGGLMDVALHPDFATNRLVYLTASTGTKQANRTTLFRGTLNESLTELTNVQELYRVSRDKSGGQHFGSIIEWLPDGSLLLSIGDGGNPPATLDGEFIRTFAQDPTLAFGKVLRMTDEGNPHPANPFASGAGDAPYVYTLGHRNIQGIALRPSFVPDAHNTNNTPEVWVTEHGAKGGDELNRLTPGGNYAWPLATYSTEYWGPAIADSATREGTVDPYVVWTPSLAPCGLAFYTGTAFPEWTGDLLAGGLASKQIRRVHFNSDGEIDGHTTLQFNERIRWIGMSPTGHLHILTDETDGGLYRIDPK